MNLQEKDSAVKKINERYTDIARKFGKDSGIAKDYLHSIELVFGKENLHTAKKREAKTAKKRKTETAGSMGLALITRNKSILENISDFDIDSLLRHHTAGEIMRDAKQEAKEESRISGQTVTVDDVLEAMDFINELESDDSKELYEAFRLYWDTVGAGNPRPSYMLLKDIIESKRDSQAAYDTGDNEGAQNIENKLFKRIESYNTFNAEEDFF